MTNDNVCVRCKELGFRTPYPVWPKDPEAGLCLFHSEREDKGEEFTRAIKKMIEAGNYKFRGFVFPDARIFSYWYLKNADFRGATFQGDALFHGSTFKGFAFFSGATFERSADFWQTEFGGNADFSGTTFQGQVLFEGSSPDETEPTLMFSDKVGAFFSYVNFHAPEKATFRRVNLAKCALYETDLRKINFIDVKWAKQGWRDALYDELHKDTSDDFASLAEMYRQLKINYEEKRDWGKANDFHYGQMEMQRKDRSRPSIERILIWIYKYLAGYGVHYQTVFLWIVLCWLAFGAVYSWLPGFSRDGLLHSLRAMTLLDRGIPAQPGVPAISTAFKWLTSIQSIIGPTLFALLILALRRRFRF